MLFKGKKAQKVILPSGLDKNLINSFIKKEYNIYIIKAFFFFALFAGGVYLIYRGVVSQAIIKFSFAGLNAEFNDAMPGVIIVFLSVIVFLFSNPKIEIKK